MTVAAHGRRSFAIRQNDPRGFRFYGANRRMWEFLGPEAVLAGPFDTGKGQPLDALVYTPQGPRPIGDLVVGDLVLTPDGGIAPVTGVFPQGVRPVYRLTFSDGFSVLADDNHLWQVGWSFYPRETVNGKRRKIPGGRQDRWEVLSTGALYEKRLRWRAGTKKETRRKYWVPLTNPLAFAQKPVPMDPYLVGILLSEGSLSVDRAPVGFSSGDEEVLARVAEFYEVRHRGAYDYTLPYSDARKIMRELGLSGTTSGTKFVPDSYKYNAIEVRREVLRGLFDGDGTVDYRTGCVSYSTISEQLAHDVCFLIQSLGGFATINPRDLYTGNVDYRVNVFCENPADLFFLPRKKALCQPRQAPLRRMIDSIAYVGRQETVCIRVGHADHLYLTDHCLVTHNTITCLSKVHAFLSLFPGAQGLAVRKSYKALTGSALVTYEKKVLPYPPGHKLCPVSKYGGEKAEWYDYPNGSRLWCGGMDVAEKFLSAEFDIIYVAQAEELTLHEFEQLVGRATGRAGNSPYAQVIGDANPGPPTHWIRSRPGLKLFESRHQDNPDLYDQEKGEWTERGQARLDRLKTMQGLRYKRGFLGLWAGAEGLVYESWDPAIHIIDRFEIPGHYTRFRTFDFGFTHPFSCQWWAQDHDGRLYLYREIYHTQRTISEHCEGVNGRPGIIELSRGETYQANIADWGAEERAQLEKKGISTEPANKEIAPRIDAVMNRLKAAADDKPRLFILRDSLVEEDQELRASFRPTSVVDEFLSYVWPDVSGGRAARTQDEVPIDKDNHGMDAMGYMVMHLDGGAPYKKPGAVSYAR